MGHLTAQCAKGSIPVLTDANLDGRGENGNRARKTQEAFGAVYHSLLSERYVTMPLYCAHYLTLSGEQFGTEIVRVDDDEAAVEHFRAQLSSPWARGFEIWQENRLVHREISR